MKKVSDDALWGKERLKSARLPELLIEGRGAGRLVQAAVIAYSLFQE
jgi:hypothetical protein